jgi:predicted nicotinamide N-methyase
VARPNPLRASLEEQILRLRGSGPLPDALLDIVSDTVGSGGRSITLIRPRDWDELRHQEGAEGRMAPYWARPWPSGLALGDAIGGRDLAGMRVLELGCGLGVPSIVAAGLGARVVATDGSPDAVAFAAHNLAVNDAEGEVAMADWRSADELVRGGPWDLVLAADVLYLRHNVQELLRVLPKLIDDQGEAIVADPTRAGGRDFMAAARSMFRTATTPAGPEHPNVLVHTLRRA